MLELNILSRSLVRCIIRRPFSSSTEPSKYGNDVSPAIYNRNPRNLERLRIAPKHSGYILDSVPTNYWHRLVIQQSNRHIGAHIEHYQGNVVVSASTKEWAIKQFLRNTTDKNAATAIGKVLGQRCLECGLLEVKSDYKVDTVSSKVSAILKGVEEAGVSLSEPERYRPHRHWSREVQENPAEIFEDS